MLWALMSVLLPLRTTVALAHGSGTLTVTGNAGTGSSTTVGNGGDGWCPGYTSAATASIQGGSVAVSISPSPGTSCAPGKLRAGLYDVVFINDIQLGGVPVTGFPSHCGSGSKEQSLRRIGSVTVDANGYGSGGPYSLPLAVPSNSSAICVVDSFLNGLAAPINII